jgi:hypothetical protein
VVRRLDEGSQASGSQSNTRLSSHEWKDFDSSSFYSPRRHGSGRPRGSPTQRRRAEQSNYIHTASVAILTCELCRRQRPAKRRRKAGDDDDEDDELSSSEDLDDDEEMAPPKKERRSESPTEPSSDENDEVKTEELSRGARSKARVSLAVRASRSYFNHTLCRSSR